MLEQKRIQDEKERRETETKRQIALRRAQIERAKELKNKKYTFDYNGNLMFVKNVNNDDLPKKQMNLPYEFKLSQQEIDYIEEMKRQKKLAKIQARQALRPNFKKKEEKPTPLPERFAKPIIASKFEYDT